MSEASKAVRADDVVILDDSMAVMAAKRDLQRFFWEFGIFLFYILFKSSEIFIDFFEKLLIVILPRSYNDVEKQSKRRREYLERLWDDTIDDTWWAFLDITSDPEKKHYPYQKIIPSRKYE